MRTSSSIVIGVAALLVAAAPLGPLAGTPPAVQFTDVTSDAGVSYLHHVARQQPLCIFGNFCEPERITGGAAVADVDGDGYLDLYVTRLYTPDILFINNDGDGTFSDGTSAAGLSGLDVQSNGATFCDIDNDGDPDLYVTTMGDAGDVPNNRNYLFINNSGVFTEDAVARGVDVGSGRLHRGFSVACGDYDRDGWPDLHVNEWLPITTSHSRLFRNVGSASPGFFENRTFPAGVVLDGVDAFSSALIDIDDDGWPDLPISADFLTSRLFWSDGDGTFSDGTVAAGVGTDENGMGSTIADFDGDGDLDWFVTSVFDADQTCQTEPCNWGDTGNRLYRYEGNRTFSDATDEFGVRNGYWGWGAAFFDYDNDGDLDLTMTNGVDFPGGPLEDMFITDPMRLWENDGTAPMTEISAAVGLDDTAPGKGLLVFDYDDDGDQDIFLVNNAGQPRLYRNDGGNDNDWVRVQAVGTTSAREAIGARVTVTDAAGTRRLRLIGTVTHFLGQSEAVAHFGLGQAGATVPLIEIKWPTGKIEGLEDVPVRTTVTIQESACTDGDGDDYCSGYDCDDTNGQTHPGAVEVNDGADNQCPGYAGYGIADEIAGTLGFFNAADRDEFSWPAQSGATSYEVARSGAADFSVACTTTATSDTFWSESATPGLDAVFYYLVRPAAPHAGSWGHDSEGLERPDLCP
jgi:hypothetical protein